MKSRFLIIILVFFSLTLFAEVNKFHFYDIKKVRTVEGKITDFKIEKVYKRKSSFFFIYIDSKDGEKIKIEVCPEWYFSQDIAKGMKIRVKGSDIGEEEKYRYLIAKEIEVGGDKLILRDKFGFPLWRGKNPHKIGFGDRKRRGRGGKE